MARTIILQLWILALSCAVSTPSGAQSATDESILQTLQTTRVNASYDNVDFDKIIDDLRKAYGLNIHVSWKLLEAYEIRRDDRLEIQLTDVTLGTLLDNILREAEPGGRVDLQYQIEDGVIVVSTHDALAANTLLRVYDVTDLISSGYSDRRFFSTPVLSLALTGREALGGENVRTVDDQRERRGGGMGGGGGGFGGGNVFEEGERSPAFADMERVRELIDLVVEAVTPDEWEMNGGLTATIRARGSTLLVRHTTNGHQKLTAFLDLLRKTQPEPVDAEAIIVRIRDDQLAAWRDAIGSAFPRIDAARYDDVRARFAPDDVLFHGVTSGHNGSRLWFSALTQRDLLIDIASQVGQNVNAFTPVSGFVTQGVEIIALPRIAPEGGRMNLDIQMAWVPDVAIDQRQVAIAPGETEASIDRVTRSMRTVSTAVELRAGEAIALSIPHEFEESGPQDEWEEWLILRVRLVDEVEQGPDGSE